MPTPLIFSFVPALIFGLPWQLPSAARYALASWSSAAWAIASDSPLVVNDWPEISSWSPLKFFITEVRVIPASVICVGRFFVLTTCFLALRSKPRTLTFSTCWTEVTRGRKLWRSSG